MGYSNDGSSGNDLTRSSGTILAINSPGSVLIWFRPATTSETHAIWWAGSNDPDFIYLHQSGSSIKVTGTYSSAGIPGSVDLTSSYTLTAGEWAFVAVSWTSSAIHLQVGDWATALDLTSGSWSNLSTQPSTRCSLLSKDSASDWANGAVGCVKEIQNGLSPSLRENEKLHGAFAHLTYLAVGVYPLWNSPENIAPQGGGADWTLNGSPAASDWPMTVLAPREPGFVRYTPTVTVGGVAPGVVGSLSASPVVAVGGVSPGAPGALTLQLVAAVGNLSPGAAGALSAALQAVVGALAPGAAGSVSVEAQVSVGGLGPFSVTGDHAISLVIEIGGRPSSAAPGSVSIVGALAGIYLAMSNAIRSYFAANIEPALGVPVQYDNQELDHPGDAPWVRLTIGYEPSEQIDIGPDPTFRKPGTAVASIFYPIELGDGSALELADVVADAFRGATISGITFRAPELTQVGRVKDTASQTSHGRAWWRIDVRCPFYADDTVAALQPTAGAGSGFAGAAATVRARFDSLVTGPEGLAGRVQFDNQQLDPPGSGLWVCVHILPGLGEALDIASTQVYRSAGVVICQIFAPIAEGDGDALELGDSIVAAFRAVTDTGVTFGSPTVVPVGRSDQWWQVNVQIPFNAQRVA